MKRFLITLFLCWIGISGYTQHDPGDGISGLGISITGLWNLAVGNYHGDLTTASIAGEPGSYFDPGLPLPVDALLPEQMFSFKQPFQTGLFGRYGLWLGRVSEHVESTENTGAASEINYKSTDISSFSFGLSVGLEKHMNELSSKMDPYAGTDFVLSILTGLNYQQSQDITSDGIKGDSYTSHSEYSVEYPGGIGGSFNLFAGFNYFVFDRLSIGGEAGAGLGLIRIGGDWVSDYSGASTEGQSTTTSTIYNNPDNENKLTGLSINSFGRINLNFYW